MSLFETSVKETIDNNSMLSPSDKIIVGLSGGADSVSLVHILKKLQYNIVAVHINHMIRGEEALRDEQFVIDFCKENNIPLKVFRKDIPAIAVENGISEELAGRKVRYQCFNEALIEYGASKVAVAHNMDDNLETMVFNLLRGSGLKGLSGIPPVNGNIIRPLINTKRYDIEYYLKNNGILYITDSSNNDNIYSRNIIRNLVVPHFKAINPSCVNNAKRCADILRLENNYIQKVTDNYIKNNCTFDGDTISITIDNSEDPVIIRRAIISCVERMDKFEGEISCQNVSDILSLKTGKTFLFGKSMVFTRAYDKIVISTGIQSKSKYEYPVCPKDSCLEIKEISDKLMFEVLTDVDSVDFLQKNTSYLDLDKLNTLSVRNRREGDRFTPSGMTKEKKLKDFFIDTKIPFNIRNDLPLLCSDSTIAAIIGIRTSELFKVDKHTKNILKVTRGTKDEN